MVIQLDPHTGDQWPRGGQCPGGRWLAGSAQLLLGPLEASPRDPPGSPAPKLTRPSSGAVPAAHWHLGLSTRRGPRSLPCRPGGEHTGTPGSVSSHRKRPAPGWAGIQTPERVASEGGVACGRAPAGRVMGTAGPTRGAASAPHSALTCGGSVTSREEPRQGWHQSGCCPAVPVSVGARGRLGPQSWAFWGPGAAGTHKPRSESWAWRPRGARGPWWSCWSGASCQAVLPRCADGAGVSLASLHRWERSSPSALGVSLNPRRHCTAGAPVFSHEHFTSEEPGGEQPARSYANPKHLFLLASPDFIHLTRPPGGGLRRSFRGGGTRWRKQGGGPAPHCHRDEGTVRASVPGAGPGISVKALESPLSGLSGLGS